MKESLKRVLQTDMSFLEQAIKVSGVPPYEIVEQCMTPFLRDTLGAALYAYSANQDALTDKEEQ